MCPNKVFKFFNVANPLVISICYDRKGLKCSAHDFFYVNFSILPLVNYQITFSGDISAFYNFPDNNSFFLFLLKQQTSIRKTKTTKKILNWVRISLN
jgi:hypothetical protein